MIDTSGFVAPPAVDWAKIMQDILNAGICQAEIARRLNLDRQAPYRWKRGVVPMGNEAVALIAFHAWVMSK